MKYITLILVLCLSLEAKDTIWHGHIGKSEVYMVLPCDPNDKKTKKDDCNYGRYFYRSKLLDIELNESLPSTQEHSYRLQVKHSFDNNHTSEELFELNYENKQLIGTWKNKSNILPILLKPYTVTFNCDYIDECFNAIKKKFLTYSRGKTQKFPKLKKELVWIHEKNSNVSMFRLGNGFSSNIRNILNPIFDTHHTNDAITYLTCTSRWNYGSGMEVLDNDITYLSKDLIAYSQSLSYFCGGAYPDFYTHHTLYDLHTGKKYKLEDIVVFSDHMPKNTNDNSDVWENYVNNLQAKKLRELGFKTKGIDLKPQGEKDTYDPYIIEYWQYMDWSYEKEGIRFFLSFHGAERCFRGDNYFIPFSRLKKYKNKSFPYPWY